MPVKTLNYTKCVCCKEEFSEFNVFTQLGAVETQLSGLCERCFDSIFEDDDEEDNDEENA